MKKLALMISVLSLSSCASLPDTSDQLVGSTDVKQTNCYSQDPELVGAKVKGFLERCYGPTTTLLPVGGILVPVTSGYQVVEEGGDNKRRYSVRSKHGFGISVDINSNAGSCRTQVSMYALRSHLRDKFNRIDDAINDKNPGCGII